jgi:TolA-binding protein
MKQIYMGWRFAMTRISGMISVLAVAMFFTAAPARGDDYTGTDTDQQSQTMQQGQKDECLLVAMNCPDSYRADTVDQRIDRLQKEIAKGTDVYTAQELKTLHEQLKWINEEKGGGNSSE